MRSLRRLGRDRQGATLVEFAITAPVMILSLMALGDLLYQVYAQSILDGALQKAGRDSGIQGGSAQAAAIDAVVLGQVTKVMKTLTPDCSATPAAQTYCTTRQNFSNFSSVAPEPFTDTNNNGKYDKGECYTDVNGNGVWDADGASGQGGASDVTQYTMSVTYRRLFPMAGLMGASSTNTITSQTLLKNQPYATQTVATPTTRCN